MTWLPAGLVKTSCQTNMTYFPFDTQFCEYRFGSWSLTKDKIAFRHVFPYKTNASLADLVIDETFHYNSTEWEIGSKQGVLREKEYPCCPGVIYQDFLFQLELKRYTYTPIVSLLIPCGLTSLLAILTFFVPPDAGEKISLSK